MRPSKWIIIEALANTVTGVVMSNVVLWMYGIPIAESMNITATIIAASFARSYILRLFFRSIYG